MLLKFGSPQVLLFECLKALTTAQDLEGGTVEHLDIALGGVLDHDLPVLAAGAGNIPEGCAIL